MNGPDVLGVLVVALLGAASAALCGYDIQRRQFALAGFLAFVGVAVTVGATIALAAGILLYNHPELILWLVAIWTACGLLIGAVFVAEGWLELRREVERLEYEADALHQENCQLHDELGEARLWAGDGPRLRVVRDDTPPVASDDDWFARLYDERGNVR